VVVSNGAKRGVPLGDVWEIPYLNPEAAERVGYPTQKPILLLERIIELVTSPGDWVLDPFSGSGTTLVAAKLMGRNAIGIDLLADAVELANKRLQRPVKTNSHLMEHGRSSYLPQEPDVHRHLAGLEYVPVARNKGIDGILRYEIEGRLAFIRVQRDGETLSEAALSLKKAARGKGSPILILVQTNNQENPVCAAEESLSGVRVIPSMELMIANSKQDEQILNLHKSPA
jgi:site-specific DNA-methyltransferase (adenine-specific)